MERYIGTVLVLCTLAVFRLYAQENPVPKAQALFREAMTAARNDDTLALLERMQEVVQLRPNHPAMTYVLAQAYMLNGRRDEALQTLEHLAAMGMTVDAAGEEGFSTLRGTERFENLLAAFEHNRRAVTRSTIAVTLPEKGYLPEGIARDPRDASLFVGSVHRRKITRVRNGVPETFATAGDGLWGVFGMAVDTVRNLLWVATAAVPQTQNLTDGEAGQSAVCAFDLTSGSRIRFCRTAGSEQHTFGDLAVAPNGDVYISDAAAGAVYVVPAKRDTLVEFIAPGVFPSPQGIVCTADGAAIFIADYSRGLARIDRVKRTVEFLSYPDDVMVLGIDGLALHGGKLVAIQNGIVPPRVVSVALDSEQRRIQRMTVLERNNPLFDEPTLGVVSGDTLYYIANSQWGKFDGRKEPSMDELKEPLVLQMPLGK